MKIVGFLFFIALAGIVYMLYRQHVGVAAAAQINASPATATLTPAQAQALDVSNVNWGLA